MGATEWIGGKRPLENVQLGMGAVNSKETCCLGELFFNFLFKGAA
jgi:hypothetical protein